MKKILHIAPHLGGGVGKALSGILSFEKLANSEFKHKLLVMERPKNTWFVDICLRNEVEIVFTQDLNEIQKLIEVNDITIMHWWHHPLNVWLLANFPKIECRFVLWSHINGCTYPKLPYEIIAKCHKTFVTSKYTMHNPYWTKEQQKLAQTKAEVVYGLGELENVEMKTHKKNNDFVIGYVGTINFSKLNPDFVEYCNETIKLLPNAKFVLVGNPECREEILRSAKKLKIEKHFEFLGYMNDVDLTLKSFDVFGYPLNNRHFGTTENTILEAMNAGIPVVTINQNSEKYLIADGKTGVLAENPKHYAEIMKDLFVNVEKRSNIAKNAKAVLLKEFSMKKNVDKMKSILREVLSQQKEILTFDDITGTAPYEWFLNFLGDDYKTFIDDNIDLIKGSKPIFKEKSKSSVQQFCQYFPEDNRLKKWNYIINEK